MFTNYIKTAFRSLFRQKGYSLLNALGLTVGLTVSLLILHWANDEVSVDGFHENIGQLHRILANIEEEADTYTWETIPFPSVEVLANDYPEIEDVAGYDLTNKKQFKVGNRDFLADGLYATDGFFRVFSFPFLEGKSLEVFQNPKSVAISERTAEKLFGKNWEGQALGQFVEINGESGYVVSGVYANVPENSSIQFDFALSLAEMHKNNPPGYPWGNFDTRVVFQLSDKATAIELSNKIEDIIIDNNEYEEGVKLTTQPFSRKYLYGQFENGIEAGGRIEYVRLFVLAALFLLVIACINFMNLATARASKRAKEVGVRKTVGAGRKSLVIQFMVEAGVITFLSVVMAILLGEILLPVFQEISGKELSFEYTQPQFWLLTLGVAVVTSLLAGSYPAFFLSSFNITNVIKGKLSYNFGGGQIRRGLVVFQFVLSALLVVGALVVQNQVQFIQNKHLGLDKENVFYFNYPPGADGNLETFKSELLAIPGINQLTYTNANPLSVGNQTGDLKWEGMKPDDGFLCHVMATDDQFISTMNVSLIDGRDFSPEIGNDTISYILNEAAVKQMDIGNPIGKNLEFWGVGGPIVGVVKDFHIGSLYENIGPLVLINWQENTGLAMMRIDPQRTDDIIAASQKVFEKHSEGHPFRYDFLDDRYLQMYKSEERTSNLSQWFALVALFISCLGLFGLSAFIAEQRTKEIGIRKVLGASSQHLVTMLSKDFLRLVLLSFLIAFPVGWYLMDGWLQNFAYRIQIGVDVFALAGGIALSVALLTVGFQAFKAASGNPVEALRSD